MEEYKQMKICKNCKTENNELNAFCTNCKIEFDSLAKEKQPIETKLPKHTNGIVSFILVLIIMALLYFYNAMEPIYYIAAIAQSIGLSASILLISLWLFNIANRKTQKSVRIIRMMLVLVLLLTIVKFGFIQEHKYKIEQQIEQNVPKISVEALPAQNITSLDNWKIYNLKNISLKTPFELLEDKETPKELKKKLGNNLIYADYYYTSKDNIAIYVYSVKYSQKADIKNALYGQILGMYGEEEAEKTRDIPIKEDKLNEYIDYNIYNEKENINIKIKICSHIDELVSVCMLNIKDNQLDIVSDNIMSSVSFFNEIKK